jgi:cobalamin biosynthesis Mg chelatase CobN
MPRRQKIDITEEIKRITSEIAAEASAKALEVSTQATAKAAEVATLATAKAAEVSTLAVSKALDAATLAATKAADAATAAASIATATSLDLTYIKKDISETKKEVEMINTKLDNKFVTKDEFATVKLITYGLVATIMVSVIGGLMYLLIHRPL